MEEKADPRPSITCPPPQLWLSGPSAPRLIIAIEELHIISSGCTFQARSRHGKERQYQNSAAIRSISQLRASRNAPRAISLRTSFTPETTEQVKRAAIKGDLQPVVPDCLFSPLL